MAAVHAVEVANRQGTGLIQTRVVEAAKNFHGIVIFLIADDALELSVGSQFVTKTRYIVS
jgi:hypothetical protein